MRDLLDRCGGVWKYFFFLALISICAHSFARNWQLPFLNQQKRMTKVFHDQSIFHDQSPRKNVARSSGDPTKPLRLVPLFRVILVIIIAVSLLNQISILFWCKWPPWVNWVDTSPILIIKIWSYVWQISPSYLCMSSWLILTLVMLNKLRCHTHF